MNVSKWAVLRQCSSAGMARYTKKARSAVFHAYDVASRSGVQEIRPEHLLVGIVMADESLSNRLSLPSADVIVSAFNANESSEHAHSRPKLSKAAGNAISRAADERERFGHVHTGTEHLLLGIIRNGGATARFLQGHGMTAEGAIQKLIHRRSAVSLNVIPAMA